jgi:hypothetical protein
MLLRSPVPYCNLAPFDGLSRVRVAPVSLDKGLQRRDLRVTSVAEAGRRVYHTGPPQFATCGTTSPEIRLEFSCLSRRRLECSLELPLPCCS